MLVEVLESRLGGEGDIGADARVRWDVGPQRPEVPPVLILGHLDTVWPVGTLERLPFRVERGVVRGPGTYDMKGGLIAAVHALTRVREHGDLPAVRFLVTTDEELGSPRSRGMVEDQGRRCGRVLIPEPCGPGGAVKTQRSGVALGHVRVSGRAAHAGLNPEDGINAGVALGRLLPEIEALADPGAGTTVTPTLLRAGTTVNTVPAEAEVRVDIRFKDDAEVERVRRGLTALAPPDAVPEATVEAGVELNRPAMPSSASAPLLPALRDASEAVGQSVRTVSVGGASDGNLVAAAGAAVLDGLSPDGGGAHADDEHITVQGLLERIVLLAELIPRVAAVSVPGTRGQ